jgi:hypothetical protein
MVEFSLRRHSVNPLGNAKCKAAEGKICGSLTKRHGIKILLGDEKVKPLKAKSVVPSRRDTI